MAKLWITELSALAQGANYQDAPVGQFTAAVNQTPLTLGASQLSAAFGATTKFLRLYADGACHFTVATGSSHSATVNDTPLPSGSVEYIGVKPGDKLAVIIAA